MIKHDCGKGAACGASAGKNVKNSNSAKRLPCRVNLVFARILEAALRLMQEKPKPYCLTFERICAVRRG